MGDRNSGRGSAVALSAAADIEEAACLEGAVLEFACARAESLQNRFAEGFKHIAAQVGNLIRGGIAAEINHLLSNRDTAITENSLGGGGGGGFLDDGLYRDGSSRAAGAGGSSVADIAAAQVNQAAHLLGTFLEGTSSAAHLVQHLLANCFKGITAQVGNLGGSGVTTQVNHLLADGDAGTTEEATVHVLGGGGASRLGDVGTGGRELEVSREDVGSSLAHLDHLAKRSQSVIGSGHIVIKRKCVA